MCGVLWVYHVQDGKHHVQTAGHQMVVVIHEGILASDYYYSSGLLSFTYFQVYF